MARAFNGTSHGLQSASALAALSGVSRIAVGFWLSTTYVADDDIALELSVNSNTNLGSFKVIAGDSTSTSLFAECVGNVGKNDGHCTPPSGSTWHHILINYDFSKATNETDTVYVDGVSQTLTRTTNSNNTGTFASYVLYVMSRAGTSLFADGSMADLCIWAPSSVLTSGDASSLAAGARANTVRTSEVAYYWRLDGTTSPEPNTVGGIDLTVTGATFVADPPALVGGNDGPQTVPMLLPSMGYGRDDAAGPESTVFPMRPWQRRFQWVGQPWLNSDDPVAAPASTDAPAEVAAGSGSAGDPAAAFGVGRRFRGQRRVRVGHRHGPGRYGFGRCQRGSRVRDRDRSRCHRRHSWHRQRSRRGRDRDRCRTRPCRCGGRQRGSRVRHGYGRRPGPQPRRQR
jgi:hypothetical protein